MRKRLESDVRRGQIADAALKLVVSEGVSALTVKNIAKEVGVTPPALYRHYAGKTEILAAALDHIVGIYTENRHRVSRETGDAVELLKALFFSHVRLFERHPAVPVFFYSDLLWREEPILGRRLNRHLKEMEDELTEVFRKGQEAGRIRTDEPPKRLFIAFLGLFTSLGLLAGRDLFHLDIEKQAETNWRIFENYITNTDLRPERTETKSDNEEVVP
ncbi:TetR/AcrR family transcriptional regulator [Desulfovibrio sp. Fe33]|uniref:TetR/AcrR family transcriptional regulator n=1 Tax=Desulfovibrio sp. Fe33 TaxID=3020842 RepID=UPI00234DB696|nr:TetR/AcrR family transcriptional regulator [Desulfovibrio sp. Fe33]